MDLSQLNSLELRELQAAVGVELVFREKSALLKARADIAAIAHNLGMSLQELMNSAPTSAKGQKLGPAAQRYRNPADETQTWSGRGRSPKWVKKWIESGETLDTLAIG